MKFNIYNLESFKNEAGGKIKLVKDMIDEEGKNIYKNISGYEDSPNYVIYDAGEKITGLKEHVISVNRIFPGKINKEYRMTTGHSHPKEEVYMFLRGRGVLVLKEGMKTYKRYHNMFRGDSMTIPYGVWHRVINTGTRPLEILCIFESYEGRG